MSLSFLPLLYPFAALANATEPARHAHSCQNNAKQTSTICVGENSFTLAYDANANTISVRSRQGKTVLHRIPKGYNPTLVGAQQSIAFLPPQLQPYAAREVLLYTSARRSNCGDGRGQCGSGAELYLHALSIKTEPPKVLSSILIGSCKESIELYEGAPPSWDNFSIINGKLAIKFLAHPAQPDRTPTATLTDDFKRLVFTADQE